MTRYNLLDIARLAMTSHGLEPDFSEKVRQEIDHITKSADGAGENLPDITHLLWCSIDNDDSMDLDQITVAEKDSRGTKILVGVSDVDAIVKIGLAIDIHARKNTTSIYTGVKMFPMLPEKLSTNLTSLSEGDVRVAFVIEMEVSPEGEIGQSKIYRALVKNKAKLTYNSVAAWLDNKGPLPEHAALVPGMDEQLRIQKLLNTHNISLHQALDIVSLNSGCSF